MPIIILLLATIVCLFIFKEKKHFINSNFPSDFLFDSVSKTLLNDKYIFRTFKNPNLILLYSSNSSNINELYYVLRLCQQPRNEKVGL
jgi:hypothetical protein